MVMSYCDDSIVGLLVDNAQTEKMCKTKTVIIATKVESENARKDGFSYKMPFSGSDKQIAFIEADLIKDGYVTYEIINQRFV